MTSSAPDPLRGAAVVRHVVLRLAWLSTMLAILPAVLGYGEITPTRIVRLLITIGICIYVYRTGVGWTRWLLWPPVAGWLIGTGIATATMFSVWSLLFFGVGLLYAYQLTRLWRDPDAAAYFAQRQRA